MRLAIYLAAAQVILSFLIASSTRNIVIAAFALGCLIYDWMHLAYHFDDVMPKFLRDTYWFQSMQEAHLHHHFRDNSTEFGVTTDLWDRVGRTERAQKGN